MSLPKCSEFWRSQRKALRQLLSSGNSEGSVGTTLCQALRQPLTQHVQKYVLLLLSLRDTLDEVGTRSNPGGGVEKKRKRTQAQGTKISRREGPRENVALPRGEVLGGVNLL